ncbi:AraC family transcriptional regulator [Deefgea tanakiae]|uniref:AraC family transcriptional regulator n=1 Tax=Deefgea tanakiae TaxID=2865840 RepID=A0ABX8Z814_9NEIS|nr:AraC family transcriptional regulator [Deefgea tanakiae]QZA77489.1 AraC family transcriptional regulator [Deefgea tanakiae]
MSQIFWSEPGLPFVEVRRAQKSRACYRPHTHPTWSIGVVDAGYSTFSYERSEPIRLAAGDVVVIQPHQVHSCNPDTDSAWSYQMLYLDDHWVQSVLVELEMGVLGLKRHHPTRIRDLGCYRAVTAFTAMLFQPYAVNYKESVLIELIGQIFASSTYTPEIKPPGWLRTIQLLLSEQYARDWPVAVLADIVGLSRYHFIRAFHAYTGMTPHAYLLDCRINQARNLLRTGCALADVAQILGFADQSHFHHAFKQRVAVTPRQYLMRQGS